RLRQRTFMPRPPPHSTPGPTACSFPASIPRCAWPICPPVAGGYGAKRPEGLPGLTNRRPLKLSGPRMNPFRLLVCAGTLAALMKLSAQTAAPPAAEISAAPAETAKPSLSSPPLPSSAALDRMTVIFGGKTLDGWEYEPANWTIEDGAMRGTGKYGQIFTKQDYGSFRLIVTARVVTPEVNTGSGHLGILFWGDRPAPGTYSTAHALQVQPPHGAMWDYRINKDVKPIRVIPRQNLLYHDWH